MEVVGEEVAGVVETTARAREVNIRAEGEEATTVAGAKETTTEDEDVEEAHMKQVSSG